MFLPLSRVEFWACGQRRSDGDCQKGGTLSHGLSFSVRQRYKNGIFHIFVFCWLITMLTSGRKRHFDLSRPAIRLVTTRLLGNYMYTTEHISVVSC